MRNKKEEKAMQDINQLIQLIEKDANGKLEQKDRELIQEKAEEWGQSIEVLRNSILNHEK